jgi:hypothetical protein
VGLAGKKIIEVSGYHVFILGTPVLLETNVDDFCARDSEVWIPLFGGVWQVFGGRLNGQSLLMG